MDAEGRLWERQLLTPDQMDAMRWSIASMLGMKRGEGGLVFNGLKDLSLSRQASSRGDQGVMSLIVVLVNMDAIDHLLRRSRLRSLAAAAHRALPFFPTTDDVDAMVSQEGPPDSPLLLLRSLHGWRWLWPSSA
jgi:hypothetical protein